MALVRSTGASARDGRVPGRGKTILGCLFLLAACEGSGSLDLMNAQESAFNKGDFAAAEKYDRIRLERCSTETGAVHNGLTAVEACQAYQLYMLSRTLLAAGKILEAHAAAQRSYDLGMKRYDVVMRGIQPDGYAATPTATTNLISTNIQLGNMDRARELAEKHVGDSVHLGTEWRLGQAPTTTVAVGNYFIGFREAAGDTTSVRRLRSASDVSRQVSEAVQRQAGASGCSGLGGASYFRCSSASNTRTAAIYTQAEQAVRSAGLTEYAPYFARYAAFYRKSAADSLASAARSEELDARMQAAAEARAEQQALTDSIVGAISSGLASASIGQRYPSAALSSSVRSFGAGANPRATTPPAIVFDPVIPSFTPNVQPPARQAQAAAQAQAVQRQAASPSAVQAAPAAQTRRAQPAFRHWLANERSWDGKPTANVYVANDGAERLQCRIVLHYTQWQNGRSQNLTHSATVHVFPGRETFTGLASTGGVAGATVQPGTYTVNCQPSG